jgi:hypothetical protein
VDIFPHSDTHRLPHLEGVFGTEGTHHTSFTVFTVFSDQSFKKLNTIPVITN